MTIRYAKTTEDAIRAMYDGIGDAQKHLMTARKAMADAANWRDSYLKQPDAIHQDLIILEQHINSQIGALESEIILYRRLVEDIKAELPE